METKERPIIFSTPMVQAILDGRKTQTRRVIKPQPTEDVGEFLCQLWPCRRKQYEYMGDPENGHEVSLKPYAFIGDRLWVRETYWVQPENVTERDLINGADTWPDWIYQADEPNEYELKEWGWKKKPSIFMPRKLARIWLEITNIRVERLQDISFDDCYAEGVETYVMSAAHINVHMSPFQRFTALWDSINGKKHPWGSNPWVWVIDFEKECPDANKNRMV